MSRPLFVLFSCFVVACVSEVLDEFPPYTGFILPNEEVRCVTSCPPEKTCENRNIQYSCLEVFEPCTRKGVCKEGYFRNALGSCITEEQCQQCSGENEFFACDSACDNECSTLPSQNRTNCPIVNIVCNPRCYCKDGYARDESGKCIPVDKCPPVPTCPGVNEEYITCKSSCPPEVCFQIVAFFACQNAPPCQPGCACKPGYLRADFNSPCMPTCECPQMQNAPECKNNYIPYN